MREFFKSFFVAALLIFSLNLFSDVIPDYSHLVERKVTVEDTEKLQMYQPITVYGYHTGGKADDAEIYVVKSGQVLTKGYKHNDFYLYWAFDDSFDLSDFTYDKDSWEPLDHPMLNLLTDQINPADYYIDDDKPLEKEEITYKVYKKADAVRIYKFRHVSSYNDGSPQKTEEFSPDETDITAQNNGSDDLEEENDSENEAPDSVSEISDTSDQHSDGREVDIDGCSVLFIN